MHSLSISNIWVLLGIKIKYAEQRALDGRIVIEGYIWKCTGYICKKQVNKVGINC